MSDPQEESRRGRHRRAKASHTFVRAGVTLAVPAGAVLVGVAAAGPASADTGSSTGLSIGYNQMCLDDRGDAAADYNPVQLYTCNNTAAQDDWTFNEGGSTIQEFGNMCLDVYAGGTWDGDTVDLYSCNGTGAQVWIPQADGALFNPQSDKCLDDTGWGGPGTQLQIWDCTGNANQSFTVPGTVAGDRVQEQTFYTSNGPS
jgi:Ricin-type beta-trefoil lectin domain